MVKFEDRVSCKTSHRQQAAGSTDHIKAFLFQSIAATSLLSEHCRDHYKPIIIQMLAMHLIPEYRNLWLQL